MENRLKELEIELNKLVKNSNCGIDEILETSHKIDKEIEKYILAINN